LWSEHEGIATAQESFDSLYGIPARDPFWRLRIGRPGPQHLFDFPVYGRGAMTLHRLRVVVGDGDFIDILREWATSRAGDNVTTAQFIRLAERVSGRNLRPLFRRWLYTARKPRLPRTAGSAGASQTDVQLSPYVERSLIQPPARGSSSQPRR
jgi:aminopeptidase N